MRLLEAIAWVDKQDAATKHLQKLRDAAQALRLPLEELKGRKGKEAAKNVRQILGVKGALEETVRSFIQEVHNAKLWQKAACKQVKQRCRVAHRRFLSIMHNQRVE